MDSANYKLCVEMSDLHKSASVGVLDAEKFASFRQQFPSYFAPKFDFKLGPGKVDKKGIGFGEFLAAMRANFEDLKNFKIETKVEPVDANTMKTKSIFTSVLVDAHGVEVDGTKGEYEFSRVIKYDANSKIISWEQTYDVRRIDQMIELKAAANRKIFQRNQGLYGEIMEQWGNGAFNSTNPDAKKVAAKYMSPDFIADARYQTEHQSGYKKYDGPEGCLEWCGYLEKTWAMPDFTVTGLHEGPKGEVWATGSASPIHIGTGKQMPFPTDFVHRVNFDKEGKCMYFKFFNGPSTMYQDSLVSSNEAIVPPMIPTPPRPAADKNFAKNLEVFWANMAVWGSGVYNGPKEAALKEIAKYWAKDCDVDFRYPMRTNTVMNQPFKGHEGIYQWCAILAGWDMPDFNVSHITEGQEGEILAMINFTSTVKATGKSVGNYDNIMRMIVKDGKLAHATMYQGPGASLMDAALTPDADKFFIVEHQFRSSAQADEWWKRIDAMLNNPADFINMNQKQRDLGFVNHQWLPGVKGTDAPMQCLWECRSTVTKEQFQAFIDGPDGPDPTDCLINTVHNVLPGAILPCTEFFVPNWIEAPAQPATTKGAFFWVKHEFKSPDSIKAFWDQMATLGETEMKGMLEKNNKLHMHNHTFSPTNKDGPLFCCWESEKDISVEEFQAFIDGPDGPGPNLLVNHVHKCDANIGLKPSAKFQVSIPGTQVPRKDVPTAAVTDTRAMAA